ncbi:outer membrane beta-barrel family protein [Aquimarina sp. ERC-38]|uniref:hypothetical protein n=1 Tax=Aquimarina sp. ERC-38 TaxID=2949996 RepID=UPI002246BEC4|nr:hypothetical protein [Aquimarina sp. ERC-38]UZO79832.1 outer membrane beta-barrel family protein [Aquimarina sp. ERC-38]
MPQINALSIRKWYTYALFISISIQSAFSVCYGQNLEQIGKAKLFTFTGGVAANSVFYNGEANRDPFTYFLSGNVNLNISGVYNLPFSFSYSNQKFNSSNPFSFNRLSIHPSYKWITAHIGDISMSFSPYTLSGHQFTGVGADLAPEGPLQFSFMYGRLLKESEFNPEDAQSEPAYKRFGYGFKTMYTHERFGLGIILFRANDIENSLQNPVPVSFELTPKENIVGSVDANVKIFDRGTIQVTYASSVIIEDSSVKGEPGVSNPLSVFIKTNASTQQYKAYTTNFTYPVGQGSVGVAYEHIDPEYRTFGAYFFNNDLENITANASQAIFGGKVNIAVNAGLQRDDLDNTKSSQLQRVISAVNLTYTPSEKLNLAGGYSNFQSYTNIKNQFDYINEVAQSENLDTLDFQQISQNANLNANYILQETEHKNSSLTLDLSYQSAVSQQGGEVTENGDSNFYNTSTAFSIGYPQNTLSVSAAMNVSYNTLGEDKSLILGPSLSASKQFFEKRLRTTGSVSYNQNRNNGLKEGEITNFRISSNYSLKKKHNLNLNFLSQFRKGTTNTTDFTATLGYTYIFKPVNPKLKLPKRRKIESPLGNAVIEFKYRDSVYGTTQAEVNTQLADLQNKAMFRHIPSYKRVALNQKREALAKINKAAVYKVEAIQFLEELYSYEDFVKGYHQLVFDILVELQRDMQRLDHAFEKAYIRAKVKVENHPLHQKSETERKKVAKNLQEVYQERSKSLEENQARLVAHRWMLPLISSYTTINRVQESDALLSELMEKEKDNLYKLKDEGKTAPELQRYLIEKIIDFYFKASQSHTDPEAIELKYIEKF